MHSQAGWWIRTITAALEAPMSLPDPRGWTPASAVPVYPDASGGLNPAGTGFGAVVWLDFQIYVAHFWPPSIRLNTPVPLGPGFSEQKLAHHTYFLESVAGILFTMIRIQDMS